MDALRALAILGVVLGHWLVTALVADGGALRAASPLGSMSWLAPVSWMFQTLAVFFMVGGHVATRSLASARARGGTYGTWLSARMSRLFVPVAAVLAVWAVAAAGLLLGGASFVTVHTVVKLALSPLWFLLVFAALTAATPWLVRLNPLWPLAVVLHVDLVRFGLGGPSWLGWVNLAAGWLVPYTAGRGLDPGRAGEPPRGVDAAPRRGGGDGGTRRMGRLPGVDGRACRARRCPTSTRRRWRPSPSAWPSAAWPCCCASVCAGP